MERVQELIDKLWKQHRQQEHPDRLLATVHQLEEVLLAMVRNEQAPAAKVAVVMPPKRRPPAASTTGAVAVPVPPPPAPVAEAPVEPPAPTPVIADEQPLLAAVVPGPVTEQIPEAEPEAIIPTAVAATPVVPAPVPVVEPEPAPPAEPVRQPMREPYTLHKPPVTAYTPPPPPAPPAPEPQPVAPAEPVVPQPEPEREVFHLHFDITDEAPTLTQQQFDPEPLPRELHEVIGSRAESLNDRLKKEQVELAHKLKETPIKDLRKAIGVNDKFLFVRELFRGDEAMYDRSLKTINNFHILPEAEYWISRELKVKLGWDDRSGVVQSFYQLVRRRFA